MQPNDVIEKVQFAVKCGLVNPKDAMFDSKYDGLWRSLIGDNWQDDIKLAIYELASKQIQFIDTFGTYGLN